MEFLVNELYARYRERYRDRVPPLLTADMVEQAISISPAIVYALEPSADAWTRFQDGIRLERVHLHAALAYACLRYSPQPFQITSLDLIPALWASRGRVHLDYATCGNLDIDASELGGFFEEWQCLVHTVQPLHVHRRADDFYQSLYRLMRDVVLGKTCLRTTVMDRLISLSTQYGEQARGNPWCARGPANEATQAWNRFRFLCPFSKTVITLCLALDRTDGQRLEAAPGYDRPMESRLALYAASTLARGVHNLGDEIATIDPIMIDMIMTAYASLARCRQAREERIRVVVEEDLQILERALIHVLDRHPAAREYVDSERAESGLREAHEVVLDSIVHPADRAIEDFLKNQRIAMNPW